eukprot:CAMPEP_0114542258 /NCGR_PEP_ID=MMETSP0114-20121206/1745_1 /TAXON_ID=31324 /ORGANISM="Goniomonas sp, Strain m" /LENGTH=1773 /DNA_ID=CAMNT_0001726555 /DNA_START=29 /DNA_END=5350 /DNA_ORIENTATION=+
MAKQDTAVVGGVQRIFNTNFPELFHKPPDLAILRESTPAQPPGDGKATPDVADQGQLAVEQPRLTKEERALYLERAQRVDEQMQSRLDESTKIESHLLERYSEAHAKDAAFKRTMKSEEPTERDALLPIGNSTLDVDEPLLAQKNMVRTRQMLRDHEETQKSKTLVISDSVVDVIPDPGYLKATTSYQSHLQNRVLPDWSNAKTKKAASHDHGPPRASETLAVAQTTSAQEDEVEKKKRPVLKDVENLDIQAILLRKFNFLTNPRFREKAPNFRQMLSAFEADTKADGSSLEATTFVGTRVFTPTPNVVRFVEYEAGAVFECPLQLQNCTKIMQRLRVLPPASQFFSVSLVMYPGDDGLVAPGMYCQCMIRFHPDTLADFEDLLTVMTESGKMTVPLLARRKPPNLTIPDTIDCGSCFVNDLLAITIPCKNLGGAGRFLLIPDSEWPEPPAAVHGRRSVEMHPFRVQPAFLILDPGHAVDVRIEFAPPQPGKYSCGFRLVCDNCSVQHYVLTGSAFDPWVGIKTLDEEKVAPPALPPPTVCPLDLHFSPTGPGSVAVKRLRYQNSSPLPLSFTWHLDEPATAHTRSLAYRTRWGGKMPSVFSIFPQQGTFQPSAAIDFELKFRPVDTVACCAELKLVLEGLPCADAESAKKQLEERAAADGTPPPDLDALSGLGFGLAGIAFEDRVVASVSVDGVGDTCHVSLSPQVLVIPGHVSLGKTYYKSIKMTNSHNATAEFRWETYPDMVHQAVRARPATGAIAPGASLEIEILCSPKTIGLLAVDLQCQISFGAPLVLRFQARVEGPLIKIHEAAIDMGLVQVLSHVEETLTLTNACDVAARYKLEFQEHGVDSVPPTETPEVTFSPSSGSLEPGVKATIKVKLHSQRCRRLRGVVVASVEGGKKKFVGVRAEVQQPHVCLSINQLSLGPIFVRVPTTRVITIRNLTLLPTTFKWDKTQFNCGDADAPKYTITFSKSQGSLGPLQSVDVNMTVTGLHTGATGALQCLVPCDVSGMSSPIGLQLFAQVLGLVVTFHPGSIADLPPVPDGMRGTAEAMRIGNPAEETSVEPLQILFGDTPLHQRKSSKFVLRNHSGISTTFELSFAQYGAPITALPSEDVSGLVQFRSTASVEHTISYGAAATSTTVAQKLIRANRTQAPALASSAAQLASALRPGHLPSGVPTKGNQAPVRKDTAPSRKGTAGTKTTGGSTTREDASISSPHGSVGDATSVYSKRGRMLLTDAHEKVDRFRSVQGQQLLVQRGKLEEEHDMLLEGKGCAFAVSQFSGTIAAWAEVEIEVSVYSDMCGTYEDKLSCAIKGLPVRYVPVRIKTLGTPIYIEGGTLGLDLLKSPPTVDWGGVLINSPAVNRTLRVCNASPHDVNVVWTKHESPPKTDGSYVDVQTTVGPDGKVTVRAVPAVAEVVTHGPFTITPETLTIAAHSTVAVNIACAWDEVADITHHLVGTVAVQKPPEEEETIDLDGTQSSSRPHDPSSEISPLHLALVTRVVSAHLDPDNFKKLRFVCLTSDPPTTHKSYTRSISLTNRRRVNLTFSLKTAIPFSIIKTVCTAPVHPLVPEGDNTRMFTLPPGHNVNVTLRFTPPAKHRTRIVEDAKFPSELMAYFTNGESQRLPLEAVLFHPEVNVAPNEIDFGINHVDIVKTLTLVLTNPTYADAQWSVEHQPKIYQASGFMQSIVVADNVTTKRDMAEDDPTVFKFVPDCGIIPGRGRRPNIPATVTVQVQFHATKNIQYSSKFRFKAISGRGCEILLTGHGSYEEQHDTT